MPIFKYKCNECRSEFELLLARFDSPAECPRCGSEDLTKSPNRIGVVAGRSSAASCAMQKSCPAAGGCGCAGGCCGHKH